MVAENGFKVLNINRKTGKRVAEPDLKETKKIMSKTKYGIKNLRAQKSVSMGWYLIDTVRFFVCYHVFSC